MKCCPKDAVQGEKTQHANLDLRSNPDTNGNSYMINMYWLRLNRTSRDVYQNLERI